MLDTFIFYDPYMDGLSGHFIERSLYPMTQSDPILDFTIYCRQKPNLKVTTFAPHTNTSLQFLVLNNEKVYLDVAQYNSEFHLVFQGADILDKPSLLFIMQYDL